MTAQIVIYIVLFLAVATYVGINIYHLVKFRLGFRGDHTGLAISLYILVVLCLLVLSWVGAFFALNPAP